MQIVYLLFINRLRIKLSIEIRYEIIFYECGFVCRQFFRCVHILLKVLFAEYYVSHQWCSSAANNYNSNYICVSACYGYLGSHENLKKNCHVEETSVISLTLLPKSYRPFHKTISRSSAFVNWISVWFYETSGTKTIKKTSGSFQLRYHFLIVYGTLNPQKTEI